MNFNKSLPYLPAEIMDLIYEYDGRYTQIKRYFKDVVLEEMKKKNLIVKEILSLSEIVYCVEVKITFVKSSIRLRYDKSFRCDCDEDNWDYGCDRCINNMLAKCDTYNYYSKYPLKKKIEKKYLSGFKKFKIVRQIRIEQPV